jgi:hypothetical protein
MCLRILNQVPPHPPPTTLFLPNALYFTTNAFMCESISQQNFYIILDFSLTLIAFPLLSREGKV